MIYHPRARPFTRLGGPRPARGPGLAKLSRTIAAILTLTLSPRLAAEPVAYRIEGIVSFRKTGSVVVKVLNQEQFEKDLGGSDPGTPFALVLRTSQGQGSVKFAFANLPAGRYSIAFFQDVNGNGKLDVGLFGPIEPWGYYGRRPMLKPKFEQESFVLDGDLIGIALEAR